MRVIKLLLALVLAVLAVTAGIFVVAIVAGVIAIVLLIRAGRRWIGGRTPPRPARVRPSVVGDVIDVTTTEIPPDRE